MLALRQPAPPGFLARGIARIDWQGAPPDEGSRRWLVELCRAELAWADAEWRLLDPAAAAADGRRHDEPHPAEAWRLPHESKAAQVVNAHLHLDVEEWRIRELLARLPLQRAAANDASQGEAYRACWRRNAAESVDELRCHLARRRRAWGAFLETASHYRRLRAALATLRAAA